MQALTFEARVLDFWSMGEEAGRSLRAGGRMGEEDVILKEGVVAEVPTVPLGHEDVGGPDAVDQTHLVGVGVGPASRWAS